MEFYERISTSSDIHRVHKFPGGIQLHPIDGSREALERFQAVAIEALEHDGDGYKLFPPPNKSSRYPGGLYQTVVMLLTQVSEPDC